MPKIMRILIFTILLLFTTALNNSCGNQKSDAEKELELKQRELELREKELELKQNENTNNSDSYNSEQNSTNSSSSQNNDFQSSPKQKTADDLRDELYRKEMKKPKDFLSVSYKLNYKVFSGKDEIIGTIYNNASMATFKDVYLTVIYSTNTNTELSRETFVVYDYVYPGSSKDFNIKTFSPEGTKKIGVYVKSATGE